MNSHRCSKLLPKAEILPISSRNFGFLVKLKRTCEPPFLKLKIYGETISLN
uniref:Uncharacterized protein n=1 Tax=Yersinia enterocolitica TaxID=630 RepID=B0RL06_YEREN|nr:hypothetical protein [Yersinia enterocolitica]